MSSAKQYSSFKNVVPWRVIKQAWLACVLDVFKTNEGFPSYYCHLDLNEKGFLFKKSSSHQGRCLKGMPMWMALCCVCFSLCIIQLVLF